MKNKFFRIGDIVLYFILILIFAFLISKINAFSNQKASKVEIYINGKLSYIYPLQKEEKVIFLDTDIGGVNIEFKDFMVRCKTSNSPRQIAVKQGFIKDVGEIIIGVPDRLVIKIVGEEKEDSLDFVIK